MAINIDLIQRVHAFVVALDPLAAKARATGHDTVLGLESLNREVARCFIEHFGQRTREVAVSVRFLRNVSDDVPNGVEIDIVKRRTTGTPDLVKLERAAKGLLVGRSDLVAVAKVLAEEDGVIVGSARPSAVLATHEKPNGIYGAAVSQLLKKELDVPVGKETV